MITNFESITYELTEAEHKMLPMVISGFKNYTKDNPIKEPDIVSRWNERHPNAKLTGARLRKLVNYIRANGLLPLIATSKGYYVSYDKAEIEAQIKSLRQRAASIISCADGLEMVRC